jgi:predicted alpha/beta superfamily hydrolase
MTRFRLLLLTLISAVTAHAGPTTGFAQSAVRATIELIAPSLPDSATVYVTGSLPALGSWNPAAIRLPSVGGHTWRLTITLDRPTSIEYKFTRGSWASEAADSSGTPLTNFAARISSDTVLTNTVQRWTSGPRSRVLNGTVTGTLRYHRAVQGAGLAARDLAVWLPPGYDAASRKRYAVLYMLDGQNVFDPATSAFGTDWAVDEAVDSLIRDRKIAPMIVVAINNTASRSAEYMPGATAAKHAEFMIRTVKPLIDRTYRTRPGAQTTFVGGSSAGGIAAFMMVWEHPEIFSRALAFSPAFQAPAGSPMRFDYVPHVRDAARLPKGVRFYIDIGGGGLEDQLRPGVDAMVRALRAGYREGSDIRFVADSLAEHSEIAWRRRFPAALVWMLR